MTSQTVVRSRLLFDATLLSHGLYRSSARSGIFFATYNLLRQFVRSGRYEVSLYCDPRYLAELRLYLAEETGLGLSPLPVFSPEAGADRFRTWAIGHKERAGRAGGRFAFWYYRCLLQLAKLACSIDRSCVGDGVWREALARTDVYFSPVYKIPKPVLDEKRIACSVLLYDVISIRHPELKPERCRGANWWLRQLLDQLNAENRIRAFAISEETRRDVLALCPNLNTHRIAVAPLAADSNRFRPCHDSARLAAVREKYGIGTLPYFLVVGTIEPRKNLLFAVRAFASFIARYPESPVRLVVVGGSWARFEKVWRSEVAGLGSVRERIVQTGYVDDEDLPVLYSDALAFVFPSLYEGFGLPLLEAMQCGCPVLSSKASAMPEVVGNAGVLFDPRDEEDCVRAMERIAFDEALRKYCVERGLVRANEFSWKRCLQEIERGLAGGVR